VSQTRVCRECCSLPLSLLSPSRTCPSSGQRLAPPPPCVAPLLRRFASRAAPLQPELSILLFLQRKSDAGQIGDRGLDPDAASPLLSMRRAAGVLRDGTMGDGTRHEAQEGGHVGAAAKLSRPDSPGFIGKLATEPPALASLPPSPRARRGRGRRRTSAPPSCPQGVPGVVPTSRRHQAQ